MAHSTVQKVLRMFFFSPAPQYCENMVAPPEQKPKQATLKRNISLPASPIAESFVLPSPITIIVSTSAPLEVSRFCRAIGIASEKALL